MNRKKNRGASFKTIIPNAAQTVRSSSHRAQYKPTTYIHRNLHYEILIIRKGGGTHNIDFTSYPVLDNQLFFLRPGQMHQFSPSADAEFHFIAIDHDEIALNSSISLSQFQFFQPTFSLGYITVDTVTEFIGIVETLQKELIKQGVLNQDIIISSYIVILLVMIDQECVKQKGIAKQDIHYSSLVVDFNHLLDDSSFKKRFVRDYADTLFVTPNYLNEKVKLETGKPASYWIYQSLIHALKKQLAKTTVTINALAESYGFSSSSHLTRFFKASTGMTPMVFRKTYQ